MAMDWYQKMSEGEGMIPLSVLRERLQLPESMTFDDYVRVDDELQAHEDLTEADIVAELQSDSVVNAIEEEEEEEEENAEVVQICSHAEAKRHLHELRKFFEASSRTSDLDFSNINKLELSLLKNVTQRQTSIQDYLM